MSNENVCGSDIEERLLELSRSFSDGPRTSVTTETEGQAAENLLADMNFSFSDRENDAEPSAESVPVFRNLPVDVWMADRPDELQFAIRLLSSSVKKGMLPVWSVKSGVAFLFCPYREMGKDSVPHVFEISNPDATYRRCHRDLEDELYDKDAQRRIFVFPSRVLKNRSVLICQTRSETIQLDNKEPMVDAALTCLNGSVGRHVFFLSPLASQFGVLKTGTWWDERSANGKLHFVLCNLGRLKNSGHDVSSPIEGAICNFQKLREHFYPDAWWHVCDERSESKFENRKELLSVLLSPQDEGEIGRLKVYRPPSSLRQSPSLKKENLTIGGGVRLAYLRLRLHADEWVLKSLLQDVNPIRTNQDHDTSFPYPQTYLSVLEELNGSLKGLNCACTRSTPFLVFSEKEERDFLIAVRTEIEHHFDEFRDSCGRLRSVWEWLFDYLVGRFSHLMVAQIDKDAQSHRAHLVSSSVKEMRETAFYKEMAQNNSVDASMGDAFSTLVKKLARICSLLIFAENALSNNSWRCKQPRISEIKGDFENLLNVLNSTSISVLMRADEILSSEVSQVLKRICSRAKPGRSSAKALELANRLVKRYENARREVVGILSEKSFPVKHSFAMVECLTQLGNVIPEIVLEIIKELKNEKSHHAI